MDRWRREEVQVVEEPGGARVILMCVAASAAVSIRFCVFV